MMLLNNDYYLDLKSTILSNELSTVISNEKIIWDKIQNHINDKSAHYNNSIKTEEINNISYSYNNNLYISDTINSNDILPLKKDTIKYIPISYNSEQIQKIIDETPHNLNKFTLIFLFVVDERYTNDANNIYELNLENNFIKFNNFYNGNLIVMGDWLHYNKNYHFFKKESEFKIIKKSEEKIKDPEKYDGFDISVFLSKFENYLNDPENIDNIIDNETQNLNELNKIIISGSGLNSEYSIISFSDNTANINVKNLKFKSTIISNELDKNSVNLSLIKDINNVLPSKEKLLMLYPFENNTTPILNEYFIKNIQKDETDLILLNLENYLNKNDESFESIKKEFINLKKYAENSDEVLKNYFNEENNGENNSDLLAIKFKNLFLNDIINIISEIDNVKFVKPSIIYNDYIDSKTFLFDYNIFLNSIKNYVSIITSLMIRIIDFLKSTNLKQFLICMPNIVNNEIDIFNESNNLSGDNLLNEYKQNKFDEKINLINDYILKINSNIISKINNTINNFDNELFNFKMYNEKYINSKILNKDDLSNSYNKLIKFGNNSNTCKVFELLNSNIENAYFYFDDKKLSKYIFNILFMPNEYKFIKNNPELNDFDALNKDATICFWSNIDILKNDFSNLGFFGFKINNDKINFTIDPGQIHYLNNFINFDKAEKTYNDHKNDWLLWEFKINHKFIDNENKIGIKGRIHRYIKIFDNIKNKEIYKYSFIDLNRIDSDNEYIKSPINDMYENDEFKFKNFEMIVGYNELSLNNDFNIKYLNGYIRNLMFFAGHLSNEESYALFREGIQSSYDLKNQNLNDPVTDLFKNKSFFIGLIGSYNNSNINILNCVFKHNCKKYSI